MMTTKNWFEVDRKGLKQLQEGKPKTFVIRELLQNAFDEDITKCDLHMCYNGYNKVTIIVEDDSPIGFRDLTDAYTLYKSTYKRKDAEKRGRYNLGEKQLIAICESAEIRTTVGGVKFNALGRQTIRQKREKGSIITVDLKMTLQEFNDCYEYAINILIPKDIKFNINYVYNNTSKQTEVPYVEPHKSFQATLKTEIDFDGIFRRTERKTTIHLHKKAGTKYLYELGIPVCEIDCDYSVDVQQKVPLSTDRDSVQPSFLKELFAEVLNNTYDELPDESSSNVWVRTATTSDRIEKEATKAILEKRFGDKVVTFNPNDPNANDEAIAHGYKLIHGKELDADEWKTVKGFGLVQSSTAVFGNSLVGFSFVEPTVNQKAVGEFCKKVFKDFFGRKLEVQFISSPKAGTIADFTTTTLGSVLRFNVPRITIKWTKDGYVSEEMLNLIIHEMGHIDGNNHTQHTYHVTLTKLGAWLVKKALVNPKYFKL